MPPKSARQIFVVNGLPGVGKTLFGKIVEEQLRTLNIHFRHLSSIDLVKDLLKDPAMHDQSIIKDGQMYDWLRELKMEVTEFEWDGVTKDPFWRKAMSDLKLKIMEKDPDLIDIWVLGRLEAMPEPAVVFVDIREPESINHFKETAKRFWGTEVKTILVVSDRTAEFNNISDGSVLNYDYDYTVENFRANGYEEESRRELGINGLDFIRKAVIKTWYDDAQSGLEKRSVY